MKSPRNTSASCIVRDPNMGPLGRAGSYNDESEVREFKVIDCVRTLTALGLSAREIKDLDAREPMLRALSEYSELNMTDSEIREHTARVIATTLRAVGDQIQDLDIELEMLSLRHRALKRRSRILEKLAGSLEENEECPRSD